MVEKPKATALSLLITGHTLLEEGAGREKRN
jgi:hypothetical protein